MCVFGPAGPIGDVPDDSCLLLLLPRTVKPGLAQGEGTCQQLLQQPVQLPAATAQQCGEALPYWHNFQLYTLATVHGTLCSCTLCQLTAC